MPGLHKQQRSLGWCFTLNNYTDDDVKRIQNVPCQYLVYGFEVGESGTKHIQGYIHFKDSKPMSGTKKALGHTVHCEIRRGTILQAVDYCKKDGDFFEKGKIRMENNNKFTEMMKLAEEGNLEEIKEQYPALYFLHKPKILSLVTKGVDTVFDDDLHNHFEWWWGPTGTGKSRKVWEDFPVHFDKGINKWWDGYQFEDVVIIEEADPIKCQHMAYFFKKWFDRYPFKADIKGAMLNQIRPKKIIVTSNYTIEECFPNHQDVEALRRRFKVIKFGGFNLPQSAPSPVAENYNLPEVLSSPPMTIDELLDVGEPMEEDEQERDPTISTLRFLNYDDDEIQAALADL
nr:MAG: replication associated protein [Arizlama virus]